MTPQTDNSEAFNTIAHDAQLALNALSADDTETAEKLLREIKKRAEFHGN